MLVGLLSFLQRLIIGVNETEIFTLCLINLGSGRRPTGQCCGCIKGMLFNVSQHSKVAQDFCNLARHHCYSREIVQYVEKAQNISAHNDDWGTPEWSGANDNTSRHLNKDRSTRCYQPSCQKKSQTGFCHLNTSTLIELVRSGASDCMR